LQGTFFRGIQMDSEITIKIRTGFSILQLKGDVAKTLQDCLIEQAVNDFI
jgi:hypothetical protein